MPTNWNDLGALIDITESFNAPKINIQEIEDDLKETLYIFLKEFISDNINIYKDPYFEDILYNYLYSKYIEFYRELIENDEQVNCIINNTISCYFQIHTPRSYKKYIYNRKSRY